MPKGVQGFQKGHPQYGHIAKGQKNKSTLAKEEARERYEAMVKAELEKLTKVQLKVAMKESGVTDRKYALDQLIGKAEETVKVGGNVTVNWDEPTD